MELYQLKTFSAVAGEGHLTRAAEKLHASQPSVSAHIKALEGELGGRLFNRSRKGMLLTPEGRALLTKVEEILCSVSELTHEARRLQRELTGEVKVGLNVDPMMLKTSGFFSSMTTRHPGLSLSLVNSLSSRILEDIRKEELDGGYILGENPFTGIETLTLERIPLTVVAPAAWQDRVSGKDWKALAGMPWILQEKGSSLRSFADDLIARHCLKPVKTVVAGNAATRASLLAAQAGLAMMRLCPAAEAEKRGEVTILPLPTISADLAFAYLAKRKEDPVIHAMLDVLRQQWELPHQSGRSYDS